MVSADERLLHQAIADAALLTPGRRRRRRRSRPAEPAGQVGEGDGRGQVVFEAAALDAVGGGAGAAGG